MSPPLSQSLPILDELRCRHGWIATVLSGYLRPNPTFCFFQQWNHSFVSCRANVCTDARPFVTVPLITSPSTLMMLVFPAGRGAGGEAKFWVEEAHVGDAEGFIMIHSQCWQPVRVRTDTALSCVPCLLRPVCGPRHTFTEYIVKYFY